MDNETKKMHETVTRVSSDPSVIKRAAMIREAYRVHATAIVEYCRKLGLEATLTPAEQANRATEITVSNFRGKTDKAPCLFIEALQKKAEEKDRTAKKTHQAYTAYIKTSEDGDIPPLKGASIFDLPAIHTLASELAKPTRTDIISFGGMFYDDRESMRFFLLALEEGKIAPTEEITNLRIVHATHYAHMEAMVKEGMRGPIAL